MEGILWPKYAQSGQANWPAVADSLIAIRKRSKEYQWRISFAIARKLWLLA